MMQRDEYVQKLKVQLDQWNAEVTKWEAKAAGARAELQAETAKRLEELRGRRDEALYQMKLLQNASTDAWMDLMRGTEQAWKSLHEAYDRARTHFEKK
jgi:hypothetical protein